jgi:hypothetical protein
VRLTTGHTFSDHKRKAETIPELTNVANNTLYATLQDKLETEL